MRKITGFSFGKENPMEEEKKNLENTTEDEFENGKGNDTPEDATTPEPPTTEAA